MIDLATAETAVDQAAVRYDRQGDQHYDVISAFIKSVRGSDADAALHYLARMIEAGEDPRFIARRLVILASEDIGLADPTALADRGRGGAGGAADRDAGGPAQPRPGHDRARGGAEVQRRDQGDRRRQRRRPRRQDRAGAAAPARRPLRRREEARPRRSRTPTATTSRSASPSSSTPPTWSPTPSTTSPPRSAPRPRSRSAGSGSAASSGVRNRRDRVGHCDDWDSVGAGRRWARSPSLALALARGSLRAGCVPAPRQRARRAAHAETGPAPGRRSTRIERRLAAPAAAGSPRSRSTTITGLGRAPTGSRRAGARTIDRALFADLVLRETVVRAASLAHGVRRALAPETRNRIRFEMKREVKRARKQRKADLREARREWEARQRAAMTDDEDARMRRGLLVRGRSRRRRLRDGAWPAGRRGPHRRRAARPLERRSTLGARMFRDEVAQGQAEKETELRERSASCLMELQSWRRVATGRSPATATDRQGEGSN